MKIMLSAGEVSGDVGTGPFFILTFGHDRDDVSASEPEAHHAHDALRVNPLVFRLKIDSTVVIFACHLYQKGNRSRFETTWDADGYFLACHVSYSSMSTIAVSLFRR